MSHKGSAGLGHNGATGGTRLHRGDNQGQENMQPQSVLLPSWTQDMQGSFHETAWDRLVS